jgi:uncharacterized protein (DUF2164 family)
MDKRPNSLNITLSSEEKKNIIDDIIYFFETEREEKIGIIASENVFDFFMDSLGKHIYNKALDDTKLWYEHRMEDIEADYYALYKQIP